MAVPRPDRKSVFPALLVAASAIALYLPSLGADFIAGDAAFVSAPGGSPFGALSLLLDRAIWGADPMGFHLTSVLLHGANSALVFLVSYLLFGKDSPWPAFGAAMLFALHPANAEAVSWISARSEMIYTAFFLLSFIAYLHYQKNGAAGGLVLAGIFFFLSLLGSNKAPAMAAVVPLYALTLPGRPEEVSRRFAYAAAVVGLALGAFYAVRPFMLGTAAEPAINERIFETGMLSGLALYSGKLLLPLERVFRADAGGIVWEAAGLALISFTAFLYIWRKGLTVFLVAGVIIALLPSFFTDTIGGDLFGERHMYLAAAVFSVLLASLFFRIGWKGIGPVLVVSALVVYVVLAAGRVQVWKNEGLLLERALAKEGTSYANRGQATRSLMMVGFAEARRGEHSKAGEHLLRAIDANPGNQMVSNNIESFFERLYERRGEEGDVPARRAAAEEAALLLEEGIEYAPGDASLHRELGIWYLRLFRLGEAREAFAKVLTLNPDEGTAESSEDFIKLIEEMEKRGLPGLGAPGAGLAP